MSTRLALLLSLLAVVLAALVADRVFEAIPHLEDEVAYAWQAAAIAEGELMVDSPPEARSFLVPFVIDYNGQRFGKYPLGWPALLAIGVWLGVRWLVNPLLAGLGVWLTYRLGQKIFNEGVGLLAAALTLTSPFFWMNSGSLLSHSWGLVLSATFVLGWLDAFAPPPQPRRWLPAIAAGLALGVLVLTRPLTAIGLAFPFGLHGLYLLFKSDRETRLRLVALGLIALALALQLFLWQFVVTGDPRTNPYTLWWPYDAVGFGPGVGRLESGHTLRQAFINTGQSLSGGAYDLFGWGPLSGLFLPFGLWAARRSKPALLVGSVIFSLIAAYLAYWIGSSLFGPRYYYEGLFSLTILSAAGIFWLAGWPLTPGLAWPRRSGWGRLRPLALTAILTLLVSANLVFYLPLRLNSMYNLYTMSRADLAPFLTAEAQAQTPALVIVHTERWMSYGVLIDLENPELTSPYIFAWSRGESVDSSLARYFPERRVIHYYPDAEAQDSITLEEDRK